MSADKLARHARKWLNLPLIAPVVSALFPSADGDLAEIEELIDRVFTVATGELESVPPDFIYGQAMDATWIDPVALLTIWDTEDDSAATALADWRSEIDGILA